MAKLNVIEGTIRKQINTTFRKRPLECKYGASANSVYTPEHTLPVCLNLTNAAIIKYATRKQLLTPKEQTPTGLRSTL